MSILLVDLCERKSVLLLTLLLTLLSQRIRQTCNATQVILQEANTSTTLSHGLRVAIANDSHFLFLACFLYIIFATFIFMYKKQKLFKKSKIHVKFKLYYTYIIPRVMHRIYYRRKKWHFKSNFIWKHLWYFSSSLCAMDYY